MAIVRQPALAEILRRLRMPVDTELVKQATRRPKPIEPEKFAGLMRAWRKRSGLRAGRRRSPSDRPGGA